MGAFLVNFHAKTRDAVPVRRVLEREAERAWIGPPENGWVSFYEEPADSRSLR